MNEDKKVLNAFALVGFILGLLSVALYWVLGIVPLLAIIFSIIGLVSVKKSGQKGKGFAITGLVLGIVFLLVFGLQIFLRYNNFFQNNNSMGIGQTGISINTEKIVGTWEGSHVEQYSDGTSGLVPGRFVTIYTLNIYDNKTFSLKEYWALYEQKEVNGLYTNSLDRTSNASGEIIKKNNAIYLKIENSDINSYGLKLGDESKIQVFDNNTLILTLPEREVTFYK